MSYYWIFISKSIILKLLTNSLFPLYYLLYTILLSLIDKKNFINLIIIGRGGVILGALVPVNARVISCTEATMGCYIP